MQYVLQMVLLEWDGKGSVVKNDSCLLLDFIGAQLQFKLHVDL